MEVKTEIFIKIKLAAAFFIPKEEREKEDIKTMLGKAKATDIKNIQSVPKGKGIWADCRWVDMDGQAYLTDSLPSHILLIIYFSQRDFLRRGEYSQQDKNLPLEKDGNLELALTFRDACEALEPEVAYIATNPIFAEFKWILKTVDKIETYDSDAIADDAGLVYFNNEILIDLITERPPGEERDTLPVKKGRLLFDYQGNERWW